MNESQAATAAGQTAAGYKAEKALALFREMQHLGLMPDVTIYTALIIACEKGNKADTALDVFAEMQQRGLEPDVNTCSALISACVKSNKVDKAFDMFVEMQQRCLEPDHTGKTAAALSGRRLLQRMFGTRLHRLRHTPGRQLHPRFLQRRL